MRNHLIITLLPSPQKPNKKEKEIVRYHNFRNTYFASYEQLNNMNAQKCLVITTYT
jgi:hypothetical protein